MVASPWIVYRHTSCIPYRADCLTPRPRTPHPVLPCSLQDACFDWQVDQIPGRAVPLCMCVTVLLLSKVSLIFLNAFLDCHELNNSFSCSTSFYGRWISLLCVSSVIPSTGEGLIYLPICLDTYYNHYRLLTWLPDCSRPVGWCWHSRVAVILGAKCRIHTLSWYNDVKIQRIGLGAG